MGALTDLFSIGIYSTDRSYFHQERFHSTVPSVINNLSRCWSDPSSPPCRTSCPHFHSSPLPRPLRLTSHSTHRTSGLLRSLRVAHVAGTYNGYKYDFGCLCQEDLNDHCSTNNLNNYIQSLLSQYVRTLPTDPATSLTPLSSRNAAQSSHYPPMLNRRATGRADTHAVPLPKQLPAALNPSVTLLNARRTADAVLVGKPTRTETAAVHQAVLDPVQNVLQSSHVPLTYPTTSVVHPALPDISGAIPSVVHLVNPSRMARVSVPLARRNRLRTRRDIFQTVLPAGHTIHRLLPFRIHRDFEGGLHMYKQPTDDEWVWRLA